uniref:Uncharacterized protein n=1 Tax=Arundo donax TaxID=35708 RepID=A0A0A8ZTL1_ARUDO
MEACSPSARRL